MRSKSSSEKKRNCNPLILNANLQVIRLSEHGLVNAETGQKPGENNEHSDYNYYSKGQRVKEIKSVND